jgi:acetyl esterase/lipase
VAAGWIPASLPNRAAVAKQVNPMTYVRKDVPPLLVVQGANDNTAPVADRRPLVASLTAAGADASMHEVAGAGHGFTTPVTAWPDAEKAMFDWLTATRVLASSSARRDELPSIVHARFWATIPGRGPK